VQALRKHQSMEYDDEEKIDRMLGMGAPPDVPDYPEGLSFSIDKDDLSKICEGEPKPDATLHFGAMGTAIGVYRDRENVRIEVELREMAGPDGEFVSLDRPVAIRLCDGDCEKLDLDDDCEKGDTIHLIGTARVESTDSPQWGGDTVRLQIIEMDVEDESQETRRYG